MPIVTKMQTIKNEDGSASNVYFGVDNPKYIKINEVNNLEEELAAIYTMINSKYSELVENINSKVTAINKDIESLNDKVATLESQMETLNGSISALESQIGTLNGSIGALDGAIKDLNSRVEALEPDTPIV